MLLSVKIGVTFSFFSMLGMVISYRVQVPNEP